MQRLHRVARLLGPLYQPSPIYLRTMVSASSSSSSKNMLATIVEDAVYRHTMNTGEEQRRPMHPDKFVHGLLTHSGINRRVQHTGRALEHRVVHIHAVTLVHKSDTANTLLGYAGCCLKRKATVQLFGLVQGLRRRLAALSAPSP